MDYDYQMKIVKLIEADAAHRSCCHEERKQSDPVYRGESKEQNQGDLSTGS